MKLRTARVRMFRSILDSSDVEIESDVTALVGKNESGKTSYLQALARLNPARPVGTFKTNSDYPAWLEKKHRLNGRDLSATTPIEAAFDLEPADRAQLEEVLGSGVWSCDQLVASRNYAGTLLVDGYDADEQKAVAMVVAKASLSGQASKDTSKCATFDDLRRIAATLAAADDDAQQAAGASLTSAIDDYLGDDTFQDKVDDAFRNLLPRLFYFANYSSLPKKITIRELLQRAKKSPQKLTEDERTAVSLLRQAASDDEYLLNSDYELRKRELENVANSITDDVLAYWTQNEGLRVQIDITQITEKTDEGQQSVLDELKVRVWDDRHRLSLPFAGRSSGFRWFFSFLAAFSEFEARDEPMVILLDEPALGLHARAQDDFLRFIEERLAPKHQVVYTTHSPFMVQPGRLDRVRVVEDSGREHGAVVSRDVLSSDRDTLFPLQGALGYDLVQHLFVAPHNLVVEGTSDFTYLTVLSDFLIEQGREGLDPRWSVVPVGGADMVPTFVALLGHHLDVTVLVDGRKGDHQRLDRLQREGILAKNRIITIGQLLDRTNGDIEDLFDPADYVDLYNRAFSEKLEVGTLSGNDPIVSRIARQNGVSRFNHGRPAEVLLRERDTIVPKLGQGTLDAFERTFKAVNATLPASAAAAAE